MKFLIEKNLCPVGEEIERDIDQLLAQQRREASTERSDEIHNLLKHYYAHRKQCFECIE